MIERRGRTARDTTLVLQDDDVLHGERFESIFNAPMVSVQGTRCTIHGVRLVSTWGAGALNHGIVVEPSMQEDTRITSATVWGPGGDGFWLKKPSTGVGPQVSCCRSSMHVYGAGFRVESEYAILSNCQAYGGTEGFHLDAGNVNLSGCSASNNTDGLVIRGDNGNDGHPVITGCQFNHNTRYAVDVGALVNGATFVGCHFYYGGVKIAGTAATRGLVRFVGCTIDVAGLDVRGSNVRFDACTWPMANPNSFTIDAATTMSIPDSNRRIDGSVFIPTVLP